jgi:hypothetical protein
MASENENGDEGEDADDYIVSPYTEEQLAAARQVIVDALGKEPNPQSYQELAGNTQLDRTLVVMAATSLVIEERVTLERGPAGEALVWLVES